ncbi:hypothetical protein N7481_004927 [Penicillium waksmanii]|uniref:uncharacterized protein n=1 Tax=Penicillium waksmanii TaxID=69791 RepID=UPI002546620C|nr:uncharacterized protein N7481_004927 [Penicillium waksmanii]KAJ5982828.1 hypothetical protein N7481_004927 [Penicillium waksmanii]
MSASQQVNLYGMEIESGLGSPGQNDDMKKGEPANTADADPFGDEETAEIKYRTMKWWYLCNVACVRYQFRKRPLNLVLSSEVMIAENISLGILSLPSAVATLGMAPAAILITFLSGLSWYTGYVIGQFKLRYPQVHSMGDAGEILLGRTGREILGMGQLLFLIFLMASHILTFSILMNTLTDHGACTIVFAVVGLIISFIGTIPRTMEKVYWMSITSFISIFITTLVTMIAMGVQAKGHVQNDASREVSFYEAFLAVTNIIFAFIAHVAFFGFISETEDPKAFPKSLAMLQAVDTVMYLVTALVIYRFAGPDLASPALSSAGPLMKKVAFGLAIPTVIIAGVVIGHVACKYVYVRIFRGSAHMHQRNIVGVGSWIGICLIIWVIAWIIAESIPVFNNILSLMVVSPQAEITSETLEFALRECLQLLFARYILVAYEQGQYFSTGSKTVLTVCNAIILGIGCAMTGMGLYVSGRAIHEDSGSNTWACANNA